MSNDGAGGPAWLVAQLPEALAADPVVRGFGAACAEVAGSVAERVDGIEYQVDRDLAAPGMLGFLASWLGLELEPTDPPAQQRHLLRETGRLLGWRGTAQGVAGLLAAATGAQVRIADGGGVFGKHDPIPASDSTVTVYLEHTGRMSEQQVRLFLAPELPLGTEIRLEVGPGREGDEQTGGPDVD